MRMFRAISGIRNTFTSRSMFIAVTWISGLLAGTYFLDQTPFSSLMCSSLFDRISIMGLSLSLALPLFLSFILLRFLHFYCILPVVFLKAFSFVCCYGSFMIAYGNAGWLISGMMLFSDFFIVFLLLLQWFNAAMGKTYNNGPRFLVYFIAPTVIGCFDFFVVSPFAAMLLNC